MVGRDNSGGEGGTQKKCGILVRDAVIAPARVAKDLFHINMFTFYMRAFI